MAKFLQSWARASDEGHDTRVHHLLYLSLVPECKKQETLDRKSLDAHLDIRSDGGSPSFGRMVELVAVQFLWLLLLLLLLILRIMVMFFVVVIRSLSSFRLPVFVPCRHVLRLG